MSSPGGFLGIERPFVGGGEILHHLPQWAQGRGTIVVLSGNAHFINELRRHRWLGRLANAPGTVIRVDGFGVRLGLRILGAAAPPRATWADFAWRLSAECARQDLSVYLLGARPGVAERAAHRLVERQPELRVAGFRHGYFDARSGSAENAEVVNAIRAAAPDVLIVGMGVPRQERWLADNLERLEVPIAMTGGAVFDYLSGRLRRAPRFLTGSGLEWLGRLLIEPRRLWRRYLVGNPAFLASVVRERLRSRRCR